MCDGSNRVRRRTGVFFFFLLGRGWRFTDVRLMATFFIASWISYLAYRMFLVSSNCVRMPSLSAVLAQFFFFSFDPVTCGLTLPDAMDGVQPLSVMTNIHTRKDPQPPSRTTRLA